MSRIIGYAFDGEFDETAMEKLLTRAQRDGIVKQFDTGRGSTVWFEGRPGEEMRRLRDQVLLFIPNWTHTVKNMNPFKKP